MLKKLVLISLIISLFISCSNNDKVDGLEPEIETTTLLSFSPTIEEYSQPLSRANELSSPLSGVYAINIVWKNFTGNYEPYASGLFNNLSGATIKLINGHLYRITCTYLQDNELPYSTSIVQDGNSITYYGAPFQLLGKDLSPLTNSFVVSPAPFSENAQFYVGSYYGTTQTGENTNQSYPAIHRLYGKTDLDLTQKNDDVSQSIEILLKRAYYTLQFKHDGLKEGDKLMIGINADGFEPYTFQGVGSNNEQTSDKFLVTMHNVANYNDKGNNFGNIIESEDVTLSVLYQKSGRNDWISIYSTNPKVNLKRNHNNIISLKNVETKAENSLNVYLDSQELELQNNNGIEIE